MLLVENQPLGYIIVKVVVAGNPIAGAALKSNCCRPHVPFKPFIYSDRYFYHGGLTVATLLSNWHGWYCF